MTWPSCRTRCSLPPFPTGPQEWVWREMKAIAELRWRFLEEEDAMDSVSRIAGGAGEGGTGHVNPCLGRLLTVKKRLEDEKLLNCQVRYGL